MRRHSLWIVSCNARKLVAEYETINDAVHGDVCDSEVVVVATTLHRSELHLFDLLICSSSLWEFASQYLIRSEWAVRSANCVLCAADSGLEDGSRSARGSWRVHCKSVLRICNLEFDHDSRQGSHRYLQIYQEILCHQISHLLLPQVEETYQASISKNRSAGS